MRYREKEDHSQGMNDAWNITQDSQEDIDEKVGVTTTLQEDTQRW